MDETHFGLLMSITAWLYGLWIKRRIVSQSPKSSAGDTIASPVLSSYSPKTVSWRRLVHVDRSISQRRASTRLWHEDDRHRSCATSEKATLEEWK